MSSLNEKKHIVWMTLKVKILLCKKKKRRRGGEESRVRVRVRGFQ